MSASAAKHFHEGIRNTLSFTNHTHFQYSASRFLRSYIGGEGTIRRITVVVALLFLSFVSVSAGLYQEKCANAQGEAAIINNDLPSAKTEAIARAKWAAIEQPVGTELTMRILDVETGEVLLSDKVIGKANMGKIPYPNYDTLVGGIKKAASKGIENTRPKLSKWFTVKGYIRQLRTRQDEKERYANINIGEKVGLKPGSKMIAYTFEEMEDEYPVSGSKKITCNILKLPVELTVPDQIQAESAWTTVEGKPQDLKRVRVGQLVERQPMGAQGFMKKMGY